MSENSLRARIAHNRAVLEWAHLGSNRAGRTPVFSPMGRGGDGRSIGPVMGHARIALPPLGRRGGGWVAVQVVLLAAIFLSAIVGLEWPAPLELPAYVVGSLLVAAGAGLLAAGGGGLAKVAAITPFPAPRSGSELQTTGAYRVVRHPMYGGGVLLALGWSTIFASVVGLVLTIALAVFAHLKARREELWLEETFAGYADYRRRTRRMLIPFVW
jgi:protein-S-isoprenylcysteine O-methyltransferase Ste14